MLGGQMGKKLEDAEEEEEEESEYVTPGGDDQRKDKDKDNTGMMNTLDRTKENRLSVAEAVTTTTERTQVVSYGLKVELTKSVDEASDTAEPLDKTSSSLVFILRNDQEKVKYMKKASQLMQEFGYSEEETNLKSAELVLSEQGRAMVMTMMMMRMKMNCKKR
ncbi:hypothetical protein RFI_38123 [Reticulomyxa filosa]|uniref:Uncharacterized protein n=1 Tax=Reticulomyxa filosa TaxID=46433 RepID=X6LCV9_RETFI|nr:hypothetical protein RFI_38123 [Reticulomyxa filosa]|eukprot:ETN99358.1 hypothetical protein RFI_38123 [Reticulomyxa filosa]